MIMALRYLTAQGQVAPQRALLVIMRSWLLPANVPMNNAK